MKNLKRTLALLLALMMLFALVACSDKPEETGSSKTPTGGNNPQPTNGSNAPVEPGKPAYHQQERHEYNNDTPLVVAYSPFSRKFSPFFSETAYDSDVAGFTQLDMMTYDRMGDIIFNAIEGETRTYNGTEYTYWGPANLSVEYDESTNRTVYTAKIREDLKFWDGKPVTAKDILFTYYTYLDPTYVGSTTRSSYDIVGLKYWQTQSSDAVQEKYGAIADKLLEDGRGEGYVANDTYTQEMYDAFWGWIDEQWAAEVNTIVDYVNATYASNGYAQYVGAETYAEVSANEGLKVAYAMWFWSYGGLNDDGVFVDPIGYGSWDLKNTFPTVEDFIAITKATYENDPVEFFDTENTSSEATDVVTPARNKLIFTFGPKDPEMAGQKITSIEGIKMLDEYTVQVTTEGFSAPAVYSILGIYITPMHYYGDESKWDPDNGRYGFDEGDLSIAKEKMEHPAGAGPYVFESYKDKVVTFKANENYYRGQPYIPTVLFKETLSSEVATALYTADADAGEMTGSRTRFEEVKNYNSNQEITGDIITTSKVDNLGYGYIGINADNVNVDDNPASKESKALRKALATVLAVYRDVAYDSYYGDAASVIQYPISNTSWAAPQSSDPDYKVAFSTDAQGNDIYTASMSADEKYAAAKAAALTWFEAAGYNVVDGKVAEDPASGKKTTFEVIIPADGQGDHPSYTVLTMAKQAFEEIGITLEINDPADSNVLWNALNAGTQELWCAAWSSTIDPDMYQVYHGDNIIGKGGSNSNHYHINDPELNQLIMDARTSDDQSFRKATYKQCLDLIVDWAVEIPAYQRQNCIVFSTKRINMSTMTPDITTFWGWMRDIENLEMN